MVAVIIIFCLAILLAIICSVNIKKDIVQNFKEIQNQNQEQEQIETLHIQEQEQEQIETLQKYNENTFEDIVTPILQSYNIQPNDLQDYFEFNLRVDPYKLIYLNWNKGNDLFAGEVSWIYLKNETACKLYQELLEKWGLYINESVYLSFGAELCSNYNGGMEIEVKNNPILRTLLPLDCQECELKPGIYYNGWDGLVGIQQTIDYMQQQYNQLLKDYNS